MRADGNLNAQVLKPLPAISSLTAPELSCVVASGQSPKETWDNLAVAEVHCIVCNRANKVRPSCLIVDIWPCSRAGILLLSHHLSSPLCNLWTVTGGFPAAALISVCLSFSISDPRERSVLFCAWKDGTPDGRHDRRGTIGSVLQSRCLGVSKHTPVCAACLRPVVALCVLSLQLYLTGDPHNSIKHATGLGATAAWPKTRSKFFDFNLGKMLTHSSDFHCHDFTHVCCTACI